jgi:multiple sugar transport system permease protein/putative aldouronate transport system permease protein
MMNKRIRQTSGSDKAYYAIVHLILVILTLAVLYPLVFVLSSSFSAPASVLGGKVYLWPVDLSLEGYKAIFRKNDVFIGYGNSAFYAVIGTACNVFVTMLCAYPLSRRDLPYKSIIMFIFIFTMYFNGGMIPTYMLVRDLGLIDTRAVMILVGLMSVYNMIIARTFIATSIPGDLLESARIDGCSDLRYFFYIILPLSKAVMAVIALYYAIGHWNSYFNAFLYLNSKNKYPLQIFLREILIANQLSNMDYDPELMAIKQGLADVLKYALIVVATVPVLAAYPFAQKYFIKGVMIGSLKG